MSELVERLKSSSTDMAMDQTMEKCNQWPTLLNISMRGIEAEGTHQKIWR